MVGLLCGTKGRSLQAATLAAVALGAAALAAALLVLIPPAAAHAPDLPGESSGAPGGLAGLSFIGPAGTSIASSPCSGIADNMAWLYDDDNTGHIGHINAITDRDGQVTNWIEVNSIDTYHLWTQQYNNPRLVEGPHAVDEPTLSVMMGTDGFFRGRMHEPIPDEPGYDMRVYDVHEDRTYCIYGSIDHDGPFFFADSTYMDPTPGSMTPIDLAAFYTPLFTAYYPNEEPRLDWVVAITSAYIDEDPPIQYPPVVSLMPIPPGLCGWTDVDLVASAWDMNGGAITYTWDFGDSTTGTGAQVTHQFPESIMYVVTVRATDPTGLWDEEQMSVFGGPGPQCCPSLVVPSLLSVEVGQTVEFLAVASDAENDPLTFAVEPFQPGGTAAMSPGGAFSWTPTKADVGRYMVWTTVSDGICGDREMTWLRVTPRGYYPPAADHDADSIADDADNCPGIANPDQADVDVDGLGDACDDEVRAPREPTLSPSEAAARRDRDGDGVADGRDVCPDAPDANQADLDADGEGDACDLDIDGDRVPQSGTAGLFLDNCPLEANPDQRDGDGDGLGDACDAAALALPAAARGPEANGASVPAHGAASPVSAGDAVTSWLLAAGVVAGAGTMAAAGLLPRRRQQRP